MITHGLESTTPRGSIGPNEAVLPTPSSDKGSFIELDKGKLISHRWRDAYSGSNSVRHSVVSCALRQRGSWMHLLNRPGMAIAVTNSLSDVGGIK